MAFTKLYLTNRAAPYTPATIRGAWDDSAGAVTKALDPQKDGGGALTSVARAETNATNNYDVLLYRGVSGPLAAQTITCNLDVLIGVLESSASANDCWHLHVYVTQGDSDTPRATLLSDYVETTAAEWPTTRAGKALAAVQAVSQAVSAGDRIVVEIGYVAINTVTTSFTGTLYYGTSDALGGTPVADLTVGGDPTLLAGYVSFSASVAEAPSTALITQESVRTLSLGTPDARVSQLSIRTLSMHGAATGYVSQLSVRTLSAAAPPPVTGSGGISLGPDTMSGAGDVVLPGDAMVTQVGLVPWGAGTPEARTTQTGLIAWGATDPDARVTDVALIVWGTPQTPFVGPDGGGIVATGANPLSGDSLCGSETPLLWGELQLDAGSKRYAWVDQPINLPDGQADPRIVGLSTIRRALSDFSGQIEIGGCTVDLYDADGVIRGLIGSNTLIRKRFDFYMEDDAGRRAGTATASRRGMFVVADYEAMSDMTVRLTLEDRLGSQSVDATLRKVVPKRTMDGSSFPSLPSSLGGASEQIPYGILSTPDTGAVQVWYVGQETLPDGNDYYAGFVAGCATWGVIETFASNGASPAQRVIMPESAYDTDIVAARHGSLWTTNFGSTLYRVLNGKRYTMMYFRVGSTIGEAFKDDSVPVTVNLGGIEEVGDGMGKVITSLPRQTQHFWTNFVIQDHETDANWYSIPVDNGYTVIDADTFTAADTEITTHRMGTGYLGQWVIGHDLKPETVGDWARRLALGGDLSFGINRHGQLIATIEAPLASSVRDFTFKNVLDGTYSLKKDRTLLANVITIQTYKNYVRATNGLTSLPDDLIPSAPGGQTDWLTYRPPFTDPTSIANLGGDPLGQREFHYEDWTMRDPLNLMADSVAAHNLNRRKNGPNLHRFETDLCGLDLELGDVFTIAHYAGLVSTARRVRLTAIELVPPDPFQKTFSVALTGYDITDLPTNSY